MDPSLSLAGSRLPPHTRVISSTRDFLIARIAVFSGAHQFGVLWDPTRDELALSVISALSYRDLNVRDNVLALAMLRGKLTVYYATNENLDWARQQIQDAADAVLQPIEQQWEVLPLISMPMTRSAIGTPILDWSRIPADHALRVIPERYQLGRVTP